MHRETLVAGRLRLPECGITPAFQLICMLRRERHNLRSGCTCRSVYLDEIKDLLNLQAAMHGLETIAKVHPHWHLVSYIPSMAPCHRTRYNDP